MSDFHLGAQNDITYIIYGEKPALNNDYSDHNADMTAVAKVLDDELAQALVTGYKILRTQLEQANATIEQQQAVIEAGKKYIDLAHKWRNSKPPMPGFGEARAARIEFEEALNKLEDNTDEVGR